MIPDIRQADGYCRPRLTLNLPTIAISLAWGIKKPKVVNKIIE